MTSYTDLINEALSSVFEAYCQATGTSEGAVAKAVARNASFLADRKKHAVNVTTADRVLGHFSFLWPEGVAWPEGVIRPAPIPLPEGVPPPEPPKRRPRICPHCGKPLALTKQEG